MPIPTLPWKVVVESREVDEAKRPLLAHSGEVVAAVMTLKLLSHVNGFAPPAEVASVAHPNFPAPS